MKYVRKVNGEIMKMIEIDKALRDGLMLIHVRELEGCEELEDFNGLEVNVVVSTLGLITRLCIPVPIRKIESFVDSIYWISIVNGMLTFKELTKQEFNRMEYDWEIASQEAQSHMEVSFAETFSSAINR